MAEHLLGNVDDNVMYQNILDYVQQAKGEDLKTSQYIKNYQKMNLSIIYFSQPGP